MHNGIAEAIAADLAKQGEWLSVEEYAARVHVSQATVRNACARGTLSCQRVGRQWRVFYLVPRSAFPEQGATERERAERQLTLAAHEAALEAVVSFGRAALLAGEHAAAVEMTLTHPRPTRARAMAVLAHIENTLKAYEALESVK